MNFIQELRERGLIHDITPGVEEHFDTHKVRAYIGFDPTAPSLTIGNYVQVMLLQFLQRAGHQPVVLMGGATGRIGDPSGKDKERDLKSYDELDRNIAHQKAQFAQLLNFDAATPNHAILLNNYDFYKNMNVLDFLRDVGKYLTVNYMMSKESVQRRLETGISYTEFSYQLLQGYDFVMLNKNYDITVQMGGSDQFGNITAGVELSRKIADKKVYAVTTPLLTKSDGTKFGKSESGNIWLDPKLTSPYKFYQFWLNTDDRDLPKFLRYFSLLPLDAIVELEQNQTPQQIKKVFAEEITRRIHGDQAYETAMTVSGLIFDPKSDESALLSLDVETLAQVAEEIPSPKLDRSLFTQPIELIELLSDRTGILSSRSEAKKAVSNNAISVNKRKIAEIGVSLSQNDLLHGRFMMVENGKKNKFLIELT